MKATLRAGMKHEFQYLVPESKTVPHLYTISEGTHERFVIDPIRFLRKVQEKAATSRPGTESSR